MEIKDIRLFMEWCVEGPSTYPKRKAMFEERKAHMESEIANMNRALDITKTHTLDKAVRYPCYSGKELFPGRTKKKASEPEGPEAVIPTPVIHRIYGVKYVPSRPPRTTVFARIFPVQQ